MEKPQRPFDPDVEVRTRSIPAAGHLVACGFEPLRVFVRADAKVFVFSPAAREAMEMKGWTLEV